MPSTPAASPLGDHDLRAEAVGHNDTERPPPLMGTANSGGIAESTRIGPPPDLSAAGPPTPRGLRAAAPLSAGRPVEPRITAASPPAPAASPPGASRAKGSTAVGIAPVVATENAPLTRRCTSCDERYPADFVICPRDATPLVDETEAGEDPLVGKLLGETYQIVRVVGEGGMGRVYEARHLRLKERRFAVKVLHAELARNAEMAARFRREAESVSSLSHPNVIDVFDVFQLTDGRPYFVGEFLEGEELGDTIEKSGPLEPRQAVNVARQVCSALAAAHERGIIHRDLKPENVFVLKASASSPNLSVKVLDFGISKAGSGDDNLTRTGVIMGTPSYMSPEQARGKVVDHRADVYSVGASLYYMLTGKRPFDADDPTSTISLVLTQEPVRPREIDPKIPEALELVVQRAMAKEVSDRYASMTELDAALASLQTQERSGAGSSQMTVHETPRSAFEVAKIALQAAESTNNLARLARPTIIVASSALSVWLVAGTVAALAGLVRILHEGEVTLTESLLLIIGCLFGAATPAWLFVSHVKRRIWPNSMRALALATDLKRTATAALVSYGAMMMFGRAVYTVIWRTSKSLGSGYWDVAIFLTSVLFAAAAFAAPRWMGRVRRKP